MKYLLICLFLSGCTLPFSFAHTTRPERHKVRVRRGDTLRTTTQELVRAGKIKNRGTIIVQAGTGNIAAPVEKAKAPVAVGPKASATQEVKRSNLLDSIKNYSVAIGSILLGVIILLVYRFTRLP